MFFDRARVVRAIVISAVLLVVGCQGTSDDLMPSGADKRPDVVAGSMGTRVDQQSPDFAVQDTLGNSYALSTELATADAVVLYFTMWCPICDSHASHMRSATIPDFPQVKFFLVDYVTGSIAASRSAQLSNGYASSTVLVDDDLSLYNLYQASMGTTVVIDSTGIVKMNEDYKDGVKLRAVLESLP